MKLIPAAFVAGVLMLATVVLAAVALAQTTGAPEAARSAAATAPV